MFLDAMMKGEHMYPEEMCREAHLVKNKQNTLKCCYLAEVKSSRNHRHAECPKSMK